MEAEGAVRAHREGFLDQIWQERGGDNPGKDDRTVFFVRVVRRPHGLNLQTLFPPSCVVHL